MVKKFIIYFSIIFIVVFLILNSRFVSAQIKFAFSNNSETLNSQKEEVQLIKTKLPIAQSNQFLLKIPAIGVEAPIVLEKRVDQDSIFKSLEKGVVHFVDSPLPGQKGASIILGHSSAYPWYKGNYGSVFALLGKLKTGDLFYVENGDKVLTYQIKNSLIFNPLSDNSKIDEFVKTDGSAIILISCWPVGTNYQRIAVRAELI